MLNYVLMYFGIGSLIAITKYCIDITKINNYNNSFVSAIEGKKIRINGLYPVVLLSWIIGYPVWIIVKFTPWLIGFIIDIPKHAFK